MKTLLTHGAKLGLGYVLLLWLFGVTGASLAMLVVLGLLHGYDRYCLLRLRRWFKSPGECALPSGEATWERLSAELYRLRGREEQSRNDMERALQRFDTALSALPDPLILLDAKQRIIWGNRSAADALSIQTPADEGRVLTQLLRQPELGRLFAEAASPERRSCVLNTGGRSFDLARIDCATDLCLLVAQDRTLERQSETMLRDFVANVSHELRTPLTVVRGYLELLLERTPPELAEVGSKAAEQAERMQALIDDLLLLSKLDNDWSAALEPVDLMAQLNEALLEARAIAGDDSDIVLIDQLGTEAYVLARADDLYSVWHNLLTNAVRYSEAPRRIEIAVSKHDGGSEVGVAVKDNGVGIPTEHLPRLTERFYRVDRGRCHEGGGTGLGLAIVQQALVRCHGRLDIRSTRGVGSCFTVSLPLLPMAANAAQTEPG